MIKVEKVKKKKKDDKKPTACLANGLEVSKFEEFKKGSQSCSILHCVLGVRSRIESDAVLEDTLVMGADFFESPEERIELRKGGGIPLGVGEGSTVKRAILDKNTRIGNNVVIVNKDRIEETDRPDEGFYIRNGIVVVVKNATITDGTII